MQKKRVWPGEGSRPPSVSGSIQLSTLPVGPEWSSRLFGLAPVGSRRFTKSQTNVTAERIILGLSCVVSAPLPWLSPAHLRGPPSHGGGTFLSWACALPSAALPLLTVSSKSAVVYNHELCTGAGRPYRAGQIHWRYGPGESISKQATMK